MAQQLSHAEIYRDTRKKAFALFREHKYEDGISLFVHKWAKIQTEITSAHLVTFLRKYMTADEAQQLVKQCFEAPSLPREFIGEATRIRYAMADHTLYYNLVTNQILVDDKEMTDPVFATIFYDLIDMGFKTESRIKKILLALAQEHSFHPIKDYFNALSWDSQDHISHLSSFFSDAIGIFPLLFRKWLIGAISKVFSDGQTQNPMLVLSGCQGYGKSYFAQWICPEQLRTYFIESPIIPDNKDYIARLGSKFLWEVSELGATTRRSDMEALKHFLTEKTITIRLPYGHYDILKPALASFIGTINDDGSGFLNDTTGNRRFRPVRLNTIDWEYSKACQCDQLWAQAMSAYQQGETVNLSSEEQAILNEEIDCHFNTINGLDDYIEHCFIQPKTDEPENYVIASTDILEILYRAGYRGRQTIQDSRDLARSMKKLGYEKYRNSLLRGYKGIQVLPEFVLEDQPNEIEKPFQRKYSHNETQLIQDDWTDYSK